MTTHAQARTYAANALSRIFREPADPQCVRHLAGVAQLETNYGDGWKGAGKGSNNMGAIQCGAQWTGPRFEYVDTHPNPDGTSTPYRIGFRKYLTPEDGWVDLVKVVFINRGRSVVLNAAKAGDTLGVSKALHATGYYEGFGRTVADRINNHYRALSRAIAAADGAAAPKVPVVANLPTLRRGMNDTVKHGPIWLLQTELKLSGDGSFGKITEGDLIAYQAAHGLPATGICDAATWGCLLSDDYTPEAA
jgi:peptidoglycan hydrolase-like protein with peptidoglycan-binding domain